MEPKSFKYTKFQHFKNSYKQYCFWHLQLAKPSSKTWYFASHSVFLIQTLMIVIHPDLSTGLPWNYSSMKHIWAFIGVLSHPAYLSELVDLGLVVGATFMALLFVLISIKLVVLFMINRDSSINPLISLSPSTEYNRKLLRFEYYLRHFLFDFGFIPSLTIILATSKNFLPKESYQSYILMSAWTGIFALLWLEDSLFLQNLRWSENKMQEVISIPIFIAMRRCCIFIVIYSLGLIDYRENWFAYAGVLIGVGLYNFYKVFNMLPYGNNTSNQAEGCRAIILVWGGLTLCVAHANGMVSQTEHGATLLLLVPLPLCLYLSSELIKYRYRKFLTSNQLISLTQLFHILNSHLSPLHIIRPSVAAEEAIKGFMKKFHDNIYVSIWVIFYFIQVSHLNAAKILLSRIEQQDSMGIVFSYKHFILNTLKKLQKNSLDDSEALTYVEYSELFSILMNKDYQVSNSVNHFYNELLTANPTSSKISDIIEILHNELHSTHSLYRSLNEVYGGNTKLLENYASFLDTVLNTSKFEEVLLKATKAQNDENCKYSVSDNDPHYFDNRNAVMIISEKSGRIIWLHNSSLLGYADNQLIKLSFTLLVPEPIRSMHGQFFKRGTDIWGRHFLINGILGLFMVDRKQYMNPVHLKARMMNLNDGSLIYLISVKPNKDGELIGFLSYDGCYILSLVRYI
jgi:hypothetical protein